jgi:hypothetical protein
MVGVPEVDIDGECPVSCHGYRLEEFGHKIHYKKCIYCYDNNEGGLVDAYDDTLTPGPGCPRYIETKTPGNAG